MSIEAFGEGHKGAGGTPVQGGTPAEEVKPAQPADSQAFNFEPSSAAKDVEEKFQIKDAAPRATEAAVLGAKTLAPGVTREKDSQGLTRLFIPGKNVATGKSVVLPALYPDEFHDEKGELTGAEHRRKLKYISNGGAVIGETHDETGAPLATPQISAPAQKRKSFADLVEEARKSEKPMGIEDKMRADMPKGPGTGKASRPLRLNLVESRQNYKLLVDHFYSVHNAVQQSENPEIMRLHDDIGNALGVSGDWLNNAEEIISKNPQAANVHLRNATEALHSVNQAMHGALYSTIAGKSSPVPLTSTEINRASSFAEHAVPNIEGKTNKTVRVNNVRFENNVTFINRLEEIMRGIKHPDPAVRRNFAGLYPQLVALRLRQAKRGTEKGGEEWSDVNVGPNTRRDDMNPGIAEGASRVGQVSQAMAGSPPGVFMPTNPAQLHFVYTHPNAHPVGTKFSIDENPASATYGVRRHVWTDPITGAQAVLPRLNAADLVKVPFGQHHGLKVVNRFGVEIPSTVQEATGTRALTFKELKRQGALVESVKDTTPVESHPGAQPQPAPRTPPPKKMGLSASERRGKRRRAEAAKIERDNLITDTLAAIEDDKQKALQQEMIKRNEDELKGIITKEQKETNNPNKKKKPVLSAKALKALEEAGITVHFPEPNTPEPTAKEGK